MIREVNNVSFYYQSYSLMLPLSIMPHLTSREEDECFPK